MGKWGLGGGSSRNPARPYRPVGPRCMQHVPLHCPSPQILPSSPPTPSFPPTPTLPPPTPWPAGINLDEDSDLLYIAEWALMAPVPEGWTVHLDSEGNEFFHNSITNASTWVRGRGPELGSGGGQGSSAAGGQGKGDVHFPLRGEHGHHYTVTAVNTRTHAPHHHHHSQIRAPHGRPLPPVLQEGTRGEGQGHAPARAQQQQLDASMCT